MDTRRDLTIVIVHFNTWDFLFRCLKSIYKSTLSSDRYNVVVVDNNSTLSPAHDIQKVFPRVTYIRNTRNMGFSQANNLVVKRCISDYVLLLNPDTEVEPATLEVMLSYMKNHDDVGVATCYLQLPDGRIDDACHRGFPTPWNALCHFSGISRVFPHSRLLNGYHLGYQHMEKIHEIDSACGAFMMISQKAGDEVGWLDEEYFWYGEDIDLCFRLKDRGWKIMYIPDVKTIHHKGVSSGIKEHSEHISTASHQTKERSTKARFEVMRIFYRKHYQGRYPLWLMQIVFAGIWVKEWWTRRSL